MDIIKKIKRELQARKEAERARMRGEREAEIRAAIEVKEAGGAIWITVGGTAVRRMKSYESHADIMRAVMDTRMAAVEYWRQTHGYGAPEPEELPDIEEYDPEEYYL